MASTPASHSPPVTAESRLILRQLNVTRSQVRLVELGAATVAWLVGVLVYLLALVLIDHWLIPLGSFGRPLALVVLLGGCMAYATRVIWPILRRQVNPVYAAKAIEDGTPSLKNSLINFLLLQRDTAGTKEAVLAAVEKRAAGDIAKVPVDLAVDRSQVIRLGYVLLAVVCCLAVYKIRSPKDPFQTVARVLAPWANIATPARVTIKEVSPGNVGVYHGESVTVSCSVLGLRKGEPAQLIYSSTDGQVVDQVVELETAEGTRFTGKLPPDDAQRNGALAGIRQDLVYRVRAGDCETSEYKITVSPAPTIAVERMIYDFPAYTRKAQQTVVGQGDIQGLEGTRITLHARANQPISQATLEFDPGDGSSVAPEILKMTVEEDRAWISFPLQMHSDGQTPWRSSYQIRFYNVAGNRNPQPILHRIDVTADLPPEIEWLTPSQLKLEVPADGRQKLELRAVDPDFGLKSIRLQGQRGDQMLIDQALLPAVPPSPPQATVLYDFVPQQLQLEEGDEVVCWGIAEDGRVSPLKQSAEPNVTRTQPLVIRITAALATKGNNDGAGNKPDAKDPNDPKNNPAEKPDPNKPQPQQKPVGNDPQNPDDKAEDKPNEKPQDAPSDSPMNGSEEQPGDQPKDGADSKPPEQGTEKSGGQGEQGDEKSKGGSKGEDQQPMEGEAGNSEENPGGGSESGSADDAQSQSGGGGGQEGSNSNSKPMSGGEDGGSAEGKQGGEGGSSADQGQGGGQKSSDPSAGGNSGRKDQSGDDGGEPTGEPTGDNEPSGDSSGNQGGQDSPEKGGQNNKPQHDGEAFDKLIEKIKQDPNHPLHDELNKPPKNPSGNQGGKETGNERSAGDQKPTGGDAKQGAARQPQAGEQGQEPSDPKAGKSGDEQTGNDPNGQPAKSPMNGGKPEANEGEAGSGQSNAGTDPKANGPKSENPETKNPGDGIEPGEKPPQPNGNKPNLPEKKNNDGGQQQAAPGEGGAPQKNPRQTNEGPKAGESGADAGEKKDPGAGDAGQSGAGANSDDKSGNANSDSQSRDRPKSSSPDSHQAEKGETSPPGNSKNQSDSKGGESGDRKGGGKKGAGQSAGQEGNDGPGSKSAADQGAGKADDQGVGESGTQAGDQEQAAGKTGKSGDEAGAGTNSGKPPTGEDGNEGTSQELGKGSPTDKAPNSTSGGDGGQGGPRGPVVGGGKDPGSDTSPTDNSSAVSDEVADGEAANLEYTRRATELVIDHLEDQEHNPDPDLLKQMGWTQEDLQQFVQRWKSLKGAADDKPEAKRELDESLRSLGLRAPKDRQRAGEQKNDHLRDVHDTGSRTSPPNRYREQFDAFRKGVGR